MSDTTLNAFVAQFADAAARTAFVPSPPTPASGPDSGYFALQQDTGALYAWDSNASAWVLIAAGGGNVTAAGTLTSNALIIGGGTKAVAALGSLGTTTTVLHGNAAGAPTFGAVSLTADVSGILPIANGGTGSASGAGILKATGTITNAEYLTIVTVGKQLVAAPGAGFTINFLQAYLLADFAAGAYTGAVAGGSSLVISAGAVAVSNYIVNDNSLTPSVGYLSVFNNNTKKRATLGINTDTTDPTGGWGSLVPITTNDTGDNAALILRGLNGGVDFGGGNAANTIDFVVWYTIEATT